jgi:hypothetical protein
MHFEEDQELAQLMQQAMKSRKLERDYQSLEDQIRCLKLRQGQSADNDDIEREQFRASNQLVSV